jgi:acyl-CoA synthetase (AMP-forming)/AMP-acid ligase II
MPLYHATATVMAVIPAIIHGYTVAIGHKFSNKTFWPEVRASGATVIQYVGETCRYLLAAPPLLDPETGANLDKDNKVRLAFGNGLRPDVWERFKERFDIDTIAEFYSATEGVSALWNLSRNQYSSGAIGRAGSLSKFLARKSMAIVKIDYITEEPARDPDNNNFCIRVPPNTPGELLYALDPANIESTFLGYFENSQATSKKVLRDVFAKGDAWFRTGDAIRNDAEGRFYFVDRIGDTYRWRGENVSTLEVSEALGHFPAIEEANVYGIPVPHHDGNAGCAAITLRDRQDPSPSLLQDLASHTSKTLPKFAVPLFLRVTKELVTTGNNKQQKHGLKQQGIDPSKISGEDKLFWLRDGTYQEFGPPQWSKLNAGEVKL